MKEKLPNEQLVLILGIGSIVGSLCSSGLIGIICALVGWNLANKDIKAYMQNQETYLLTSYYRTKRHKTLCLIGLMFSLIWIIVFVFILATIGVVGFLGKFQHFFS